MTTSKTVVQKMLENRGAYPGFKPMARIYSYTDEEGRKVYACFEKKEQDDLKWGNRFAFKVKLLLEDGQLTADGLREVPFVYHK